MLMHCSRCGFAMLWIGLITDQRCPVCQVIPERWTSARPPLSAYPLEPDRRTATEVLTRSDPAWTLTLFDRQLLKGLHVAQE